MLKISSASSLITIILIKNRQTDSVISPLLIKTLRTSLSCIYASPQLLFLFFRHVKTSSAYSALSVIQLKPLLNSQLTSKITFNGPYGHQKSFFIQADSHSPVTRSISFRGIGYNWISLAMIAGGNHRFIHS